MAEPEQKPQQQFAVQRIYVKDLSFEAPNAPAVFTEKWDPKVNVELNTAANQIAADVFEVTLTVTVTAKQGEKSAYLAEVKQAGIFTVAGFAPADLGGMLHSFCPGILFPYAREAVSSLVNKGSFPQLILAPVNFDALYAEHLRQAPGATGEATH
jgi:preprotein translocase subunit SecB